MKKVVLAIIVFTVMTLLFVCCIGQKEEEIQDMSKAEQYIICSDNIDKLLQIEIPELMPKIVDVIVDESEIVALCEDGRYFYIDTDNLFEGTHFDEDKAQYAPETGFSNRVMTAERNYVYWKETLIFGDSVYKLDIGTYWNI